MLRRLRASPFFQYMAVWAIAWMAAGAPLAAQQPAAQPPAAPLPEPFDNDPVEPLDENFRTREGIPGDWRGASATGEDHISDVIRAHWVTLNRNGGLTGRISTIDPGLLELQPTDGLQIRFLQSGMVRGQAATDSEGRFSIDNLPPGVYSLVASGPNGFMAYTLNVISPAVGNLGRQLGRDPIQLVQLGEVGENLEIDAAAVPPTFRTIKNLVRTFYPDISLSQVDAQAFAQAMQADAGQPNAQPLGTSELRADVPPDEAKSSAIQNHRVLLLPDGRMFGRLHAMDFSSGRPKMIQDMNVFVIQDDRRVGSSTVDKFGVFEIRDLEPGAYSLVAAGRDGFGAVGFELAFADEQAWHDDPDRFRLVRWQPGKDVIRLAQVAPNPGGMPFPLDMSVMDDPRNIQTAFTQAGGGQPVGAAGPAPVAAPAAPAGGFASGGGGGGGGGAGGGLGGLGLAAALAAAAAVAGASSGSNDNNTVVRRSMSPFQLDPQ